MDEFVNREEELSRLNGWLDSDQAELIVFYGRRRVGKSELVRQAMPEDAVYFQATETTPDIQFRGFVETVEAVYPGVKEIRQDWESVLKFLGNQNAVVVIDELPYLIEADSSIASRFQRVWDQHLSDTGIKLVVIGSSIGVMEDKVLGGSSPLHGRRTGSIELDPLEFGDARKFYPDQSQEEDVVAWSVFGGTPEYLQRIDRSKNLRQNIKDLLLQESGLLHDEPEFLLRTELSKPNRYFGILKAVAAGNTSRNEIAQETGLDSSNISSYLSKLEKIRVLEKEVPVTADPTSSRRGIYQIKEPLFRFWFRFVYGEEGTNMLERDIYEAIFEPYISDYSSPFFETLCQKSLPILLPKKYRKIGRWWYKEHEVDVVGIADNRVILGEAKFKDKKLGKKTLYDLEQKAENIRVEKTDFEYTLFSKSGFTEELHQKESEREDLHLFDLEQVVSALKSQ
ncbi:MAG: ATP-binding protein [Candidatus Nanohaloarchaea archaeon]